MPPAPNKIGEATTSWASKCVPERAFRRYEKRLARIGCRQSRARQQSGFR
jgi:hypothetical protein